MTKGRLVFPAFIVLTTLWWGWTVLVDMFIVRIVFSTIDNFFQAGDLGIAVFSKLNNLELVVSTLLVALLSWHRKSIALIIMSVLGWIISMFYFCFLTPRLIYLTDLWKKTDLMGTAGIAGIPDIQQAHQFYHNLYISTDVAKLVLLTVMLVYGIWKQEKLA